MTYAEVLTHAIRALCADHGYWTGRSIAGLLNVNEVTVSRRHKNGWSTPAVDDLLGTLGAEPDELIANMPRIWSQQEAAERLFPKRKWFNRD